MKTHGYYYMGNVAHVMKRDAHEANDDFTGLLEKVKFDSRGG